jgi:choline kinase
VLAAGVGARLGAHADHPPKALLRFGGRSLLDRHIENLLAAGVREIVIGVGYRAETIEAELATLAPPGSVRTVTNPRFREGSIVTLWTLNAELTTGDEIVLMDADVLYDRRMIDRLLGSSHENCLLYDSDFEPGEEPVKICLRDGRIVDFRKRVETEFDRCGESVGFFRFSPSSAKELAALSGSYVAAGRSDEPYEEAVRDLLLRGPAERFGIEDVTGLPWVEIDFPEDVERAEHEILPLLM